MLRTAKSLVKSLIDPFCWRASQKEAADLLEAAIPRTRAQVLNFVEKYRGAGDYRKLSPLQVPQEYLDLLAWAWKQGFHSIAEIGTANGGTLVGWMAMTPTRLVSIDLPGGIHGGGYPARKARLFGFLKDKISPSTHLELVRADSHLPATRTEVEAFLGGEQLDFLMIDGDHRYAGVKADFDVWRTLVRKGGYIGFHDIVPHKKPGNSCQVDRLWGEIKQEYPETLEIVADAGQGWAGIGIVRMV
jgi:hypothetical protein